MTDFDSADLVKATGSRRPQKLWMMTFADLMTLLLCFFVLMLSFSQMDLRRFEEVSGSMREAFQGAATSKAHPLPSTPDQIISIDYGNTLVGLDRNSEQQDNFEHQASDGTSDDSLEKLYQQLNSNFKPEIEQQIMQLLLDLNAQQLVIRLKEGTSFASGSGFLQPQFESLLRELAPFFKEIPGRISVTGHADNLPITDEMYENNAELSVARAIAVSRVLMNASPIPHLSIQGMGTTQPIADNDTMAGRELNRRVEITITQGSAELAELPNVTPIPNED